VTGLVLAREQTIRIAAGSVTGSVLSGTPAADHQRNAAAFSTAHCCKATGFRLLNCC